MRMRDSTASFGISPPISISRFAYFSRMVFLFPVALFMFISTLLCFFPATTAQLFCGSENC